MFLVENLHRSMRPIDSAKWYGLRCAIFEMCNLGSWIIHNFESGIFDPPAPIQILTIHKKIFIEYANLINYGFAGHEICAHDRVDFHLLIYRSLDIIITEA